MGRWKWDSCLNHFEHTNYRQLPDQYYRANLVAQLLNLGVDDTVQWTIFVLMFPFQDGPPPFIQATTWVRTNIWERERKISGVHVKIIGYHSRNERINKKDQTHWQQSPTHTQLSLSKWPFKIHSPIGNGTCGMGHATLHSTPCGRSSPLPVPALLPGMLFCGRGLRNPDEAHCTAWYRWRHGMSSCVWGWGIKL